MVDYDRQKVIGLILVKELAMVDKAARTPVSTLKMRSLPFLCANTPLYDLLHLFEVGRCHMAVLTGSPPAGDGATGLDGSVGDVNAEAWQQQKPNDVQNQWQQQQQQQHSEQQQLNDQHQQQQQHEEQQYQHDQEQQDEGQRQKAGWQAATDTSCTQLISTDHDGIVHDEVSHSVPQMSL